MSAGLPVATATTAPSSGIPFGLKRRPAQDAEPKEGHAAGILHVAPDGDVLLLRRASTEPNYAGHWALPGGKGEPGEQPAEIAEREAAEEMGFKPGGPKKLLDVRDTPNGMRFHTFAQPVGEKFVPRLNEEHSGYAWAPLHQLPKPLHPSVERTLRERLGGEDKVTADMTPEDWNGLTTGMLKWLAEEAAEPEHANDSVNPRNAEHTATIKYNGDFDMAGLLRHMHVLGQQGSSRSITALDGDDKPVVFGWDGDGADKILSADIDGRDALKDQAEDAEPVGAAIDAVKVDDAHDGPWISCMSLDGRTMYRNKNVPAVAEIDGKSVDVNEDLKHHEVPEWMDLQNLLKVFKEQNGREPNDEERKELYTGAHIRSGTPGEKAYCQANDIDWTKLSAWFRGYEAQVEKGPFTNPPDDADVKPMPHDHGELEATDSAPALALDRDSVRKIDKDGRMRVELANISKACINPYVGHEIPGWEDLGLDPDRIYRLLRDPDELERAAPTFNGVQLLKKHIPVSAKDPQRWDIVGTTGSETAFDAPYLRNSLFVWTQDGIDLIESGDQQELSCGYHYRPDMTPGTYQGEHYDGVMRDIVGNHVALVKDGRAGPDVLVGDGVEAVLWARLGSALAELVHA